MERERDVDLREFVAARGAALSRAAHLLTGGHQAAEDLPLATCVLTGSSKPRRPTWTVDNPVDSTQTRSTPCEPSAT
jgi:hypothetical protein